ncbi:uncharacterized protein LOC124807571 [Hydra vulgaris]|uniref:uncharacterized protein LOC124807571 n=1 Tax=Hydra vulgaris TaxID=6087 RepID=UPI001F5EFD49|nr:uncharacterized protein LOC124807571 [Hydra vulgaris]
MDRTLRPCLDTLPNLLQQNYLNIGLEHFLNELPQKLDKLKILTQFVLPDVYEIISEYPYYEAVLQALQSVEIKQSNEFYARFLLETRKQQPGESFDEYLHALKVFAKECNFKQVSAIEYRNEYIRDAFITGINSQGVRQRLLEKSTTSPDEMFLKARTL